MPAKTIINTPMLGADQPEALSVLTIGHSNHPVEKFLGLLREHSIEVLVDARSQPFSRFSPQFSRKMLNRAVTEASSLLAGADRARERKR